MRKRKIIPFVALMLVMGAFFLPGAALANVSDSPGLEHFTPAPPVPDETPESSPWANVPLPPPPPPAGNPFTPDGTATVTDNATSEDKEFFTFTTAEGNVFFLIIDRSRPTNNVYFLNAVTEADLMALAQRDAGPDSPSAPLPEQLPHPPQQPVPPIEPPVEPEPPPEPEPTAPGNNGTIIFAGTAALVFGGAAYYLKIVRPKKQGTDFDDEDEEYDEEDELDEYEDEEDEDEAEDTFTVESILKEYGNGKSRQISVDGEVEVDDEQDDEEERLYDEIH